MTKRNHLSTDALAAELSKRSGMTVTAARKTLAHLADITRETLQSRTGVFLPGIVHLTPGMRAARKGIHPTTRAPLDIPAKPTVTAKPVKALIPAA